MVSHERALKQRRTELEEEEGRGRGGGGEGKGRGEREGRAVIFVYREGGRYWNRLLRPPHPRVS